MDRARAARGPEVGVTPARAGRRPRRARPATGRRSWRRRRARRAEVNTSRRGAPGRSTHAHASARSPPHTRSGSSATACPDSTSRMCACRSAVSNRTSGSNPATRHSCSAQWRDAVPRGSITQADSRGVRDRGDRGIPRAQPDLVAAERLAVELGDAAAPRGPGTARRSPGRTRAPTPRRARSRARAG